METLGDRIRALRKAKGLTQADLGKKMGVTYGAISAIEKGITATTQHAEVIADIFKVDKRWLITGEGEAPKGIVVPIRKELGENVWKDALVQEMKEEIVFLRDVVKQLSAGKAQNFLNALSKVGATAKVIPLVPAEPTGAQLGAQAVN